MVSCRYYDPDQKFCMLLKKGVQENNDICPKFRNRTWNTDQLDRIH
jgi:hypothetical protein